MKQINQKIVSYEVSKQDEKTQPDAVSDELSVVPTSTPAHVETLLDRPEILHGSTYKIKTPLSEHALYVVINDVVLNEGEASEERRPFEIFINSKNMDHFQWIVALTRIISAVFRKGGDVTFLVEEMRSVFDPRGGYFKKGGKYVNSLVAEIGDVLETHMKIIGMIQAEELSEHQKAIIEEKKATYLAKQEAANNGESKPASVIPGATECAKCHEVAVILMDGCKTCTSCGDSKCSGS